MSVLKLNLEIYKSKDCGSLVVLDTSAYPINPESAELTVEIPGYSTPFVFEYTLGQPSVLNAFDFNLVANESLAAVYRLPDGIYRVVLATCPDLGLNTRLHLRTCSIDCRLGKQWAKVMSGCEDEKIMQCLDRIEFLLRGAEAHADLCNASKATELYIKADELLRRIEADCC